MGSLVHSSNRHISKNSSMFTNTKIRQPVFTKFAKFLIRPLYSNSMFTMITIDWRERRYMNFVLAGFKVGVKGVSFRGCFSALPIVAKIKFLYQQTAKEILGKYSQNKRFSRPRARASNVWKKERCLTPPINALTINIWNFMVCSFSVGSGVTVIAHFSYQKSHFYYLYGYPLYLSQSLQGATTFIREKMKLSWILKLSRCAPQGLFRAKKEQNAIKWAKWPFSPCTFDPSIIVSVHWRFLGLKRPFWGWLFTFDKLLICIFI